MDIVRITKGRKVLLWNIRLTQLQTQKANKYFPLGNNTIFTNCIFHSRVIVTSTVLKIHDLSQERSRHTETHIKNCAFRWSWPVLCDVVKFVYFSRLLVISWKNLYFFCFQLWWAVRYCSISLYFSFKEESTWEIRVCLQKWSRV